MWDGILVGLQPYQKPKLHGAAMRELAGCVWKQEGFLSEMVGERPRFVQESLRLVERGVRATLVKAARATDEGSHSKLYGGHVQGLQACCELMLGLLSLRGTDEGAELVVASPRMLRLAKDIRRADCLVQRLGKEVKSRLVLEVDERPEDLHRVSELVFALNRYLTGDDSQGVVRITSFKEQN